MSVVASMFPPERTTATEPEPVIATGEERGEPDGPGSLDEELRPLDAEHERLRDLVVRDRDRLVEHVLEDRRRENAGFLDRDPVRDRVAGLADHADRAHVRPPRLERERDPRSEAATADRG